MLKSLDHIEIQNDGQVDEAFNSKIEERFQNFKEVIFAINEINRYPIKTVKPEKTVSFCLTTMERYFDFKK